MLILLGLLLVLLFFGLGFALHALWIAAVVLFVAWLIGLVTAGARAPAAIASIAGSQTAVVAPGCVQSTSTRTGEKCGRRCLCSASA